MSIYALDLAQVHETIRDTLAHRVLPEVESASARDELMSVLEMLDNLAPRLSWESGALAETVSRTTSLGTALGVAPGEPEGTAADDVESLRSTRRLIAETLATAYRDGTEADMVAAVTEFSATDIKAQISHALAPGLPE